MRELGGQRVPPASGSSIYDSRGFADSRLFMPQSHDGVEAGSLDGGPYPEEQPNTDGSGEPHDHGPDGNGGGEGREQGANQETEEVPGGDARHATRAGQGHGLQQELPGNVAAPRADGLAHADLACAFGDRHQHDIHNPNATYQQADGGNHHGYQDDHSHDVTKLSDDGLGAGNAKAVRIGGLVVAQPPQQAGDFILGLVH